MIERRQWSVELDLVAAQAIDEPYIEDLLDRLIEAGGAPAISVLGSTAISVRIDVAAEGAQDAVGQAIGIVHANAGNIDIVRVEAETEEGLQRRLTEPDVPTLLGVAELAAALGVSRQRVSELSRRTGFPRPVVELKSGPVWRRSAVARFVRDWVRRPGRPPNQASAAPRPR